MLTFSGTAGGDAGNVVLLHAFPVSGAMWEPQVPALLQAGFGVIAPHVYGFDGSPMRIDWNMADYAHALARLLDSLGVEKATIAGLSMGGYQAFAFYRLFPERTASIVLCDTRANADAPEAYAQRMEFCRAVEANGPKEAADRMVPNFFAARTYDSNPGLVAKTREMITRQPAEAISDAMKAIAGRADATGLLPEIKCPVLILNGAEDRVTTPETAASMHSLVPGSKLEILPDAGHLSNLEQPDLFNRLLLEHLKSI
ncbi:MAG: alpha/beta fold hydrolase [Chlorobiaceae bacterium]|nr:alpha/beta fold hydrolase [Chlorobiaceae bacterium]